jgi:hypothetical protein
MKPAISVRISLKRFVVSAALLFFFSFSVIGPVFAASTSTSATVPRPPFEGTGCFTYVVSDAAAGWQSMPCLPASAPVLEGGEGGNYGGVYGVNQGPTSTYDGQVTVDFSQYSGESDSNYGSNSWSIQVDTNDFTGNNGQSDWVQAIYFNDPNNLFGFQPYWATCVQQWDVTTSSLGSNVCAGVSGQYLSSSFDSYEAGYLYSSGGTYYFESEYCQTGVQCWTSSAADKYGLAGNWNWVGGTILGLERGSTADFTSHTSLATYVYLTAGSSFSGNYELQDVTAESNNLNAVSPTHLCSGDVCEIAISSSN